MAYKSFYRTYRPQTFQDVVGQHHIVKTLQNALKSNRVSHAYLFCGPRGTGKTTLAKILAKAVNCEASENRPCGKCASCLAIQNGTYPDVIEIDAASNNGVDEIRDLIEKVKYAPLEGRYKVYIIDEVHMLSQGAFNALLKTLEEPPEHVIFILATTEAHKVLPTIISRCQRFDFKRIEAAELSRYLSSILEKEQIKSEDGVCDLISSLSDGGVRDALTILEQAVAYADDEIKRSDVYEIYGVTTPQQRLELFQAIVNGDVDQALMLIHQMSEQNVDLKRMVFDFIELLKNAIIYNFNKSEAYLPAMDLDAIKVISSSVSSPYLLDAIDVLLETMDKSRYTQNVLAYLEITLIRLSERSKNRKGQRPALQPIEKTMPKPVAETSEEKAAEPTVSAAVAELQQNEEISENEAAPVKDLLEVVAYMVSANKEDKAKDIAAMKTLIQYISDDHWMKVSNLLMNSEVVLSGRNFMFVAVDFEERVRQLEEQDIQPLLLEFSRMLFGQPKLIKAITQADFKQAVDLYKEKAQSQTLPDPVAIADDLLQIKSAEEGSVHEGLNEGLFELFGDDVEIV